MRKIIASIPGMLLLTLISVSGISQSKTAAKTMMWTTTSKAADDLTVSATNHLMNAEFALAYSELISAVKLDPNFTVALTFLSNLTTGATQKMYAQRALKSSSNKTPGEKLFASMADEKMTRENRQEVWAKLHKMFPDGKMISHFYVQTRPIPDDQFAAAQEFIKKFPDNASMYNTLAYYYMNDKKDNEMAKKYFEKYIAAYPNGYNPYDSMGEFYLNTGDTTNAKKYYLMSLEKYPYNTSSIIALQKMTDKK